jgi:Holliday junction DNA helicase RuvA
LHDWQDLMRCRKSSQFMSAISTRPSSAGATRFSGTGGGSACADDTETSGVGKRTAERLVVELKDKVAEIAPAAVMGAAGSATGGAPAKGVAGRDAQDAVAALSTLGFKPEQAQKAVSQLCSELPAAEQNVQNLIRRALQLLNG